MTGTTESLKGNKVLVLEFWNCTPHLETSLEIACALAESSKVTYLNAGRLTGSDGFFPVSRLRLALGARDPVKTAIRLIKHSNIPITIHPQSYHIKQAPDLKNLSLTGQIPSDLQSLREWHYKGHPLGIGVASSIIHQLKDSQPDIRANAELVKKIIKIAIRAYELAKGCLSSQDYDAVVLFNGRFAAEHAARCAALECNTDTYFHERAGVKDLYFFADYVPHDITATRMEIARMQQSTHKDVINRDGAHFFDCTRAGQSISWNSFVQHQRQSIGRFAANIMSNATRDGRIIVTYFSSSDDEYAELYGITPLFAGWGSQQAAVRKMLDICNRNGVLFCLRVHPHVAVKSHSDQRRWNELCQWVRKNSGIAFSADSTDNSYAIMAKSSAVITGGSTVGIEAIAMGVPSILITPAIYSGITPSIREAMNPEEFAQTIRDLRTYPRPSPDEAAPYGYWVLNYGHSFKFYHPSSLFSGEFLGIELNCSTCMRRVLLSAYYNIKHWIYAANKSARLKIRRGRSSCI